MRREPGNWLRQRSRRQGLPAVLSFAVLGGLCAGIVLQILWPDRTAFVVIGAVILAAVWFYKLRWGRWRLDNLKAGHLAETRVGNAIDYAVTAPGCAVAHDVMGIAKVGNIDHIVATPKRIWVVETKSSRIPNKKFARELNKIAANVQAVRKWAPPQTEIRGCLVINSEGANQRSKPYYDAKGERIWRESRMSLVNKLKDEVREAGPPDSGTKELTQRVWALGKLDD